LNAPATFTTESTNDSDEPRTIAGEATTADIVDTNDLT
jgi:hypothetical protein